MCCVAQSLDSRSELIGAPRSPLCSIQHLSDKYERLQKLSAGVEEENRRQSKALETAEDQLRALRDQSERAKREKAEDAERLRDFEHRMLKLSAELQALNAKHHSAELEWEQRSASHLSTVEQLKRSLEEEQATVRVLKSRHERMAGMNKMREVRAAAGAETGAERSALLFISHPTTHSFVVCSIKTLEAKVVELHAMVTAMEAEKAETVRMFELTRKQEQAAAAHAINLSGVKGEFIRIRLRCGRV
jgi:hypothetical protein